jgi:hypothetical protein
VAVYFDRWPARLFARRAIHAPTYGAFVLPELSYTKSMVEAIQESQGAGPKGQEPILLLASA